MIRGQARFLGKPVHAPSTPNGRVILRKSTEKAEIYQANAWNDAHDDT
jgi:pectin methylesterase-like acyl-CoA thioesterase